MGLWGFWVQGTDNSPQPSKGDPEATVHQGGLRGRGSSAPSLRGTEEADWRAPMFLAQGRTPTANAQAQMDKRCSIFNKWKQD